MATEILLTVISALVTFLCGEKLYTWIFVKEDKAAKRTDNLSKLVDAVQSTVIALQGQLERSDKDSAEKQEVIIEQQKENFELREKLANANVEIVKLKHTQCQVRGCASRKPQTGY